MYICSYVYVCVCSELKPVRAHTQKPKPSAVLTVKQKKNEFQKSNEALDWSAPNFESQQNTQHRACASRGGMVAHTHTHTHTHG
jgi:hypothetical protein